MSEQQPLKIVFVGHVDHGKSTLVGRLFHDTKSLPEGKLEQIQATCERRGVPFEWAFLMDALQAERDQNITIDTSQIWFDTDKRPYVIIDAPGHREFLKNMITGAASADAAFLLIAANEGVQEQSRRHGYLLSMLGIRQVVVLVNKMDLVDYSRETFEEIETEYREFLGQIGLEPRLFIPVSAREGDQVAEPAAATMPWFEGPTVVEALDGFDMPKFSTEQPLRLPLQDVYRFDDRRILAGRLESGSVRVGDTLVFAPDGKRGVVESVEKWSAPDGDAAVAGESVGITLTEQIFVERGHVASHEEEQPAVTNRFRANVFWMGQKPLERGAPYKLKLTTQEVECRVVDFERVIDASTLETVAREDGLLRQDDVAEVVIETHRPVALDLNQDLQATGRFVLVDGYDLSGGGIVREALPLSDGAADERLRLRPVTPRERFGRNGHRGAVVWLDGHPGAGKTTIARGLDRDFFNRGIHACVASATIFDAGARGELAHAVSAMALAGSVVVVDLPASPPIDEIRRLLHGSGAEFISVRLNAPREICQLRTSREQAQEGLQIDGPDIVVDTHQIRAEESLDQLTEELLPRLRQTWAAEARNI